MLVRVDREHIHENRHMYTIANRKVPTYTCNCCRDLLPIWWDFTFEVRYLGWTPELLAISRHVVPVCWECILDMKLLNGM